MKYTSILSERATKELKDSWEWYEGRQTGLGDRFVDTFFEKLRQIEENPTKGIPRNSPYREALIKIFPYIIIYRILETENCIFVHSVFHAHRNPKKKYRN